jgi:peptidoglycan/xylan/chitin deacetylase (PgdA/CDA1 family)
MPGGIRRLGRGKVGWLARYARLRASGLRAGVVLVYHRVGTPAGDPERELVPALDSRLFQAQLAHLAARYTVVPGSSARAAAVDRRRGQRFPVAITFDDDLDSHVREAMPALLRAGLPATFFLSGASLDSPYRFWWERLQVAADQGLELASAVGESIRPAGEGIHGWAAAIESASPEQRAHVAAELEDRIGPDPPDAGMRRQDVASLAAAGFEIGFHTRRHDALPTLEDAALESALRDGRDALEQAAARRLTAISYPHGKADERVGDAARRAGYEHGFTGIPVAVRADTDPLLVPRVEVLPTTLDEFARQLVGALERAAGQGSAMGSTDHRTAGWRSLERTSSQ